ncbi:type II secretion system protein [Candidatus Kaiserbacteria bacterium]|nr:type II secretion system protein [Candidatus Kaiserbacteria bacterium]
MSLHTTTKGFSLIEVIVYIAVLVLLSSAAVTTLLSFDTALLRNKTERVLTNAATVALERMEHDMRDALTADTTVSGQLTLTSPDATTVFSTDSGQLVLEVDGVDQGPLTPSDVTVDSVTFTRYISAGELDTEMVRVALTLSIETHAASLTETYYVSAILRNSYE